MDPSMLPRVPVVLVFGDIIIEKSILAARHSSYLGSFLN
jgi:hypothetical protein